VVRSSAQHALSDSSTTVDSSVIVLNPVRPLYRGHVFSGSMMGALLGMLASSAACLRGEQCRRR
jgi:hypothetical protein